MSMDTSKTIQDESGDDESDDERIARMLQNYPWVECSCPKDEQGQCIRIRPGFVPLR